MRDGSLIDNIVCEGARRMLAAALEAEVDTYLAELTGEKHEAGRAWWCATAATNPAP
jgi:putative transposase